MIQKKKYVRKLIRKKIMGTLTAEEEIDYTIASLLYKREELQEMIADVLLSIPDEDLTDIPLGGWKPDIDGIITGRLTSRNINSDSELKDDEDGKE
ncbi:hypothetical protein [Sphingobacterium haloxyli]|uniref:Uncharacterized protein n=1 Tax=Sphingobacterium haloxyli TaxID=2100533 RepID=A0A2S9J4N3_9SPHI|nr:hypothetical protein [Sphingobacterium haloxyli]PRD47714.1 hypothetical protein C5745_07270 [Sphingobacterium haloxyli]